MRYTARLSVSRNEEHKAWKGLGKDVHHPRTYRGTGKVEAEDYPYLAAVRLQLRTPLAKTSSDSIC